MEERIKKALNAARADGVAEKPFVEIRLEERNTSTVQYTGKELEDIGARTRLGGSARALVNGGWRFVSFNDITDLSRPVKLACE
jgi:TldD protein